MSIDQKRIERFILEEARLLDERRWSDWLALFAENGEYWLPLVPDADEPGKSISIMHEDLAKLELRCERYGHPLTHTQTPPSRTVHLVSNIMLEPIDTEAAACVATASFLVREHRLEVSTDWVGRYRYDLVIKGDSIRIRRKTVRLPNSEAALPTIQVPL